MLLKLSLREPDAHIGGKENPYIKRWFLTPWSADESRLKKYSLPNKYLHNVLRDDDDRALHCHPWNNLSIVLRGGYREHRFRWKPVEGQPLPETEVIWRGPGSIVFRRAETAHRLQLDIDDGIPSISIPAWTIFLTWRKRREWGFWCKDENGNARWVHWRIFTSPDGMGVGKGCE